MSSLAPGLLVAAPPLADPNFDRSVVLLAQHGDEGAFGWVINGRQVMTLEELLVRADVTETPPDAPQPVRLGGPVSQEQVWLVYQTPGKPIEAEGQIKLAANITASASRRVLEAIVGGERPEKLVGLVGYAGWAPLQLEEEIRQGAWLPTDLTASLIFDTPADEVWERAYEEIGTHPMAFNTRIVGSA